MKTKQGRTVRQNKFFRFNGDPISYIRNKMKEQGFPDTAIKLHESMREQSRLMEGFIRGEQWPEKPSKTTVKIVMKEPKIMVGKIEVPNHLLDYTSAIVEEVRKSLEPKTYGCFNCNNKNKECECTGYTDPRVKPSGWMGE